MNVSTQFLASPNVVLLEKDADLRPLASVDSKALTKEKTLELSAQIAEFQNVLYAQQKHKLLIILQGMDTSGKDGTVRIVFGASNPAGIRSVSFKAPTAQELAHDFLWRIHQQVPAAGELVIFNRSHYEDVLITQVLDWISADEVKRRYTHINAFESMLAETGTTILKFFLHISKDEQKERLQERLNDPHKHWKFDPKDLIERASWDKYRDAYQATICATHTEHAPWHIIPANSKTQRNLIIASIVVEKLASLNLGYPAPHPDYLKIKVE
ncbi:polyphosphate kinase 2 family protein [Undibacterium seohonense]|uniref:Polyphosphate kinase 2 family protein n=1 Tax=Undibacterium seohonense TaxID=1344950 RepID=A0ABR6X452_9BURK|nr:PPK2 family polyphosphate kinase [Undibacterium seohonense]MBC3807684.1 polyphosphate kinase 2 family protein [Undibacterium seohonense]